ncbi:protein ALP1-like [Leguminivora glycinivorella]|uniref:protein ALP1-like n=1 Tax=Leguminivora glycinivorella TaxID=1035111 RepID=UPI00200E929D|nr:protein ALP1-like [Leguminivora glycinivorella]XP_047997822.1 protein ALP1-like [Leguminivora glycinivorella]
MSEDTDTDDELLFLLLLRNKVRKRKKIWVHEINKKRLIFGEYHRLCRELETYEDRFFQYFHMSKAAFEELHETLSAKIHKQDTNWRPAISTKEKLAVCLRYLTTGDSFQTIAFSFRLGSSTVSNIVKEVCKAIWDTMQPKYMPAPTEETWRQSEIGYRQIWNFPNGIGSVDGKHVNVKCPKNSGSNYYCYKNIFSIVLLAIVDPFYKFITVDIGSYGRHSDSAIFENSTFYHEYIHDNIILPPKPLPGTTDPVPHVLIGDEGFGLKPYLMRPFPRAASLHDPQKTNFNYRLCRARRVVENAFGILTHKWRVYRRPMECAVETAIDVVKATTCLHNYIIDKRGNNDIDLLVAAEPIIATGITPVNPTNRRSSNEAFQVRDKFVRYFNSQ